MTANQLGVPGLIHAYKEGSLQAFAASDIVEIERMDFLQIQFSYPHMNEVMKIIKKYPIQIVGQEVNNDCLYNLSFPQRIAKDVRAAFAKAVKIRNY